MARKKNKAEQDEIKDPQTTAGEQQEETADAPDERQELIDKLTAERDDYLNALKRERADFENYKKRNADLSEKAKTDGKAAVIEKLLPVLDNLERAFAASDEPEDDPFKVGVQLVIKSFKDELAKLGVEEIDSTGAFDPNVHNAVMQVAPEEGDVSGNVKETLQKGYRMGSRIIRYAMVKVVS